MTFHTSWAQAQIARLQDPQRFRQAKAARDTHLRAKFDGRAEYAAQRRLQRADGFAACVWARNA